MSLISLPYNPQPGDDEDITEVMANFAAITAQANGNLESSSNVKVGVSGSTLVGSVNAEGGSPSLARADHTHMIQGVETRAANPSSGHFVGRIYFNTTTERVMVCTDAGGTYTDVDANAAPTDGQYLRSVGTVPTWVSNLINYTEQPADVNVSATSVGAANQIVSSGAITYEAVPTLIHFEAPAVTSINEDVHVILRDGSTVLGTLAELPSGTGARVSKTVRLTPTAASHTYNVAAWLAASDTVVFESGTGGAAGTISTVFPIYIKITRE